VSTFILEQAVAPLLELFAFCTGEQETLAERDNRTMMCATRRNGENRRRLPMCSTGWARVDGADAQERVHCCDERSIALGHGELEHESAPRTSVTPRFGRGRDEERPLTGHEAAEREADHPQELEW
jgi:hypothetical protein